MNTEKRHLFAFLFHFILFPVLMYTQNVGVGTLTPEQKLSVQGKLKIEDDATSPTPGTIRYNNITNDFEGWTGSTWKSLTFNQSEISNGYVDPSGGTFNYLGIDTDASDQFAIVGSLGLDKVKVFCLTNDCRGFQYEIFSNNLPSSTSNQNFGSNVELFGAGSYQVAAIGAEGNDHYGTNAGIIGVYRLYMGSSTFLYHLAPADIAAGDAFGREITGNTPFLAISSPFDDDNALNSGSVYFYRNNSTGAAFKQKILSPTPTLNGNFGHRILMSQNKLFITARGEGSGTLVGRVYVYSYSPLDQIWLLDQIINSPFTGSFQYFGASFAHSGDHLMISSANTDQSTYDGIIHYYQWNSTSNQFVLMENITIPYMSDNDNFGTAIVMDQQRMVASAPGYDFRGVNSGALFVFERNGNSWLQTKLLTVPDHAPNMYLGNSLSSYNFWYNTIVVGSPNYNTSTGISHLLEIK